MIEIQIDSQSVTAAFNRLIALGANMAPILDAIGQRMEERVEARFETTSDPTGQPWAALKPSTRKSYPKDGNHSLLDRYGDMRDSLSHQVDDTGVSIGFGQPYAIHHEFGTGKMPRRGMLLADPVAGILGQEDEDAIMDILRGAIQKAVGG